MMITVKGNVLIICSKERVWDTERQYDSNDWDPDCNLSQLMYFQGKIKDIWKFEIKITTPLREMTVIWDHTVLPTTWQQCFLPLPQPKLVLDLATSEGCKAELTGVVVTSQDSPVCCIQSLSFFICIFHRKDGPLSQKYLGSVMAGNWTLTIASHNVLTTRLLVTARIMGWLNEWQTTAVGCSDVAVVMIRTLNSCPYWYKCAIISHRQTIALIAVHCIIMFQSR